MTQTDSANASLRAMQGPFDVILADPPWNFTSNSKVRPGKNARRHYDCMSLDQIAALPVQEIASSDALLFMWVTVPFKRLAEQVVESWGFRYVSEVVWVKSRIGTGFWVRNRHEPLLICKRGRFPCPKPALFADSVIEAPTRQHSRKPDAVQDILDERLLDVSKLEMFARRHRPGWTVWGNETTKFDRTLARDPTIEDLLSGGRDDIEDLLGGSFDDLELLLS